MKSKRKQLLISSMVMLLVAMLAVTSTTFAWFSTGNSGTVSDFEFTAEDASGIQLSVDAENWKGTITADAINSAVKTLSGDKKAQQGSKFYSSDKAATFNAMSSAGAVTSGDMPLYTATVQADGSYTTSVATSGYYAFNIYVKNSANQIKALQLTSATVKNKVEENPEHRAELATRVAFVNQGSLTKGSLSATDWKANAIGQTLASGNALVYEANAEKHTGNATTYYGAVDNTVKAYDAVTYATTGTETLAADTTTGYIKASTGKVITVPNLSTDATTKPEIAELAPDSITKITVYVWLEGQDVDCNTMNDIASGDVIVNFGVTAVDKYTLEYDWNGVTLDEDSPTLDNITKKYVNGTQVDVDVKAFAATGKVFKGWSEKKDTSPTAETGILNSGDKITMSSDKTLYAIWDTTTAE